MSQRGAMESGPPESGDEGGSSVADRAGRGRRLPRLLTLAEVANFLSVSPKTVRRLRIPCVRLGRLVRFRTSDVERFLAARRFHA